MASQVETGKENAERARKIPPEVRRGVRQRDGFGCVFCGSFIFELHHIVPFSEGGEHTIDNLVCLCPNHHEQFHKKFIGNCVLKSRIKAPYTRAKGGSSGEFVLFDRRPEVRIGPLVCRDVDDIIVVDKVPILRTRFSDELKCFLIDCKFSGVDGKDIVSIEENEIFVYLDNWDVVQSGNRIEFFNKKNRSKLSIEFDPSLGLLIKQILIRSGDYVIFAEIGKEIMIAGNNGLQVAASELEIIGSQQAIVLDRGSIALGRGGGSVMLSGTTSGNRNHALRRNTGCFCGSGRRYKRCCGAF
jgi:hypothetical protein